MISIALFAALAMLIQDILSTMLVQANAKNMAWLSGILDALAWGAAIVTTDISVTALQGHNMTAKVVVILCVTAANVFGSVLGVKLGTKLLKAPAPAPPRHRRAGRRSVSGKRR